MKQLDLSRAFNCCSISTAHQIRQLPHYIKNTIISQNVPFKINSAPDAPDTVICYNQIITVEQKITKVHLLGFCNWGAYCDVMRITDKDNNLFEVPFEFSDIYWGHPVSQAHMFHGEKELQRMSMSIAGNYKGFCSHPDVRLYHCTSSIETDNIITNIILPDNEFINILAITVE